MELFEKTLIIDTEFVGLEKRHLYDIGIIVGSFDGKKIVPIEEHSYIISDIWYNRPMFATAYYSEKRERYVGMLRSRKAKLIKSYELFKLLTAMVENYDIKRYFAYNSSCDRGVLQYNAELYNVVNPLETLEDVDILKLAHDIHKTNSFKNWCIAQYEAISEKIGQASTTTEKNELIAERGKFIGDSGRLRCGAETTYRFLINNPAFIEDHTGLEDCRIELDILNHCLMANNGKLANYTEKPVLYADIEQIFTIKTLDSEGKTQEQIIKYTKKQSINKGSGIFFK